MVVLEFGVLCLTARLIFDVSLVVTIGALSAATPVALFLALVVGMVRNRLNSSAGMLTPYLAMAPAAVTGLSCSGWPR